MGSGTCPGYADSAVVLHYYGNAVGISAVAPARSAVALGTPNPDHIYATGLALAGDSDAGVMTVDGLAIGVRLRPQLGSVRLGLARGSMARALILCSPGVGSQLKKTRAIPSASTSGHEWCGR